MIPTSGANTEEFIQRVESMRGSPLEDEERVEIQRWIGGRALKQIAGTEGWDVIMDTLKSYPENAEFQLMRRDPKHKEDVLADHAVAFAASRIYNDFVNSITMAIAAADKTPDCVKQALRYAPAPVPE